MVLMLVPSLIVVTNARKIASVHSRPIYQILDVEIVPLAFDVINDQDRALGLYDFFKRGNVYYASTCDISKCFQAREDCSLDARWDFAWNKFMLQPIFKWTQSLSREGQAWIVSSAIFTTCIRGYVGMCSVSIHTTEINSVVISRVGTKRSGALYLLRGLDDSGDVANFVETETIIELPEDFFSYVIVRGSVPVFWEQQGLQLGYPKIVLSRSATATQPSFDRHIASLGKAYGLIHAVDLLSQTSRMNEANLSTSLNYHMREYKDDGAVNYTQFDIYDILKTNTLYDLLFKSNDNRLSALEKFINRDIQAFGYYYSKSGLLSKTQKGVFRVNCFDCLDRTNIVQHFISRKVIDLFLRSTLSHLSSDFSPVLVEISALWANNGDALSNIYIGTESIKSNVTRSGRSTVMSILGDIRKSAFRMYKHAFQDKDGQYIIDFILGNVAGQRPVLIKVRRDPVKSIEGGVKRALTSASRAFNILCVSWNTNCCAVPPRSDFYQLFSISEDSERPNLVVCALQEIVQLSPSQIVSTDPEKRTRWESIATESLNELFAPAAYTLLTSAQLVGILLMIFVDSESLADIRHVEMASKKTGMSGITGNKGSLAVRLMISDSSFCFVSSHLAAGQLYSFERDREVQSLLSEALFSRSQTLLDHDYVLWAGDFNYRVDLDNDVVRDLISQKDFDSLLAHDQLRIGMLNREVFVGFREAPITFAPTYKYDVGTDIFDTSDKMRVPSWTDRILAKNVRELEVKRYRSIPLQTSDHKPVSAYVQCQVHTAQPGEGA